MTPTASVKRNMKDELSKTPGEIIDALDVGNSTIFKNFNF